MCICKQMGRGGGGGGVNVGHSLSPPSHFVLATGLKQDYFVLREHLVHNGECSMSILHMVLMVLG